MEINERKGEFILIEIIKRGTKQKITCKECGCYFSYDEEDIESPTRGITSSYSIPRKVIRCPQCETVIELESVRCK